MMRWLRDNPVGVGLAALCGVLLLVMVGLGVVSMLPVAPAGDDDAVGAGETDLSLPTLGESPPLDAYYVITEKPLFNESRQPVLAGETEVDTLADAEQEADQEAPEVELSGVVITPSLRMVTLRKKDADKSLVAFEGRPIEGDFGSWEVSRVEAREVTLTSGSGEELRLQLKVHDEKIEPPERPAPKKTEQEAKADASADAESQRLSRAEEIRQRIAERREELRQQAEMEQQAAEQDATPDYQQAIRSLIGRGRRDNTENQDEQ